MAKHRIQAAEAHVRSVLREKEETESRKTEPPESKPRDAGRNESDIPDGHVVVARMDETQLKASKVREIVAPL
jgi:hypothetical protein